MTCEKFSKQTVCVYRCTFVCCCFFQVAHFYSLEKIGPDDKHKAKLALGGDTFTANADSAWEAKKKAAARALMETTYKFSKIPPKLEEMSSKGE